MGEMLGNKRQDRGKKNSGGQKLGGRLFGEMPKKGWTNFLAVPKSGGNFLGVTTIFGGRIFQEKFKKKKSPGGILWKIVKKKFRGDFLGGSYTGGRVWGERWEIKDKIGEKKISGGQKFGGERLGEMQKKGWNNFWGECCGTCKPQQILGGNFWKNVKEKNLGGKFGGGSTKGACDPVGMVRNEKKGKISPKKFRALF